MGADVQSVAARIRHAIIDRVKSIDGHPPFDTDLAGRAFGEAPTIDTLANASSANLPCAWVWRQPGNEERTPTGNTLLHMKSVRWSVLIVDHAGDDPGETQERLYADLERAIEDRADLYMSDDDGVNLVADEVRIDKASFSLGADVAGLAIVSVDVITNYPHHYGDPSRI